MSHRMYWSLSLDIVMQATRNISVSYGSSIVVLLVAWHCWYTRLGWTCVEKEHKEIIKEAGKG